MVQEKGSRKRCSRWTALHAQCSALCSAFLISHGNAEALDRSGGKTKHRLISRFLNNTSAKNYRNRIVYVKIIASRRWDVFLRHGVIRVVVGKRHFGDYKGCRLSRLRTQSKWLMDMQRRKMRVLEQQPKVRVLEQWANCVDGPGGCVNCGF